MAQSLSTIVSQMFDKYVRKINNSFGSILERNDALLNSYAALRTTSDDIPLVRNRFEAPVDVTVTSASAQNQRKPSLDLHEGPVIHSTFLIYANFAQLTLADILKQTISGILREGAQNEINQKHAKILVEKLQNVQHHADHAKDIYDIHSELGDACILLYTMETFWYRSINSTLRALPVITDDQFLTFAPFCYLLQTYLKETPANEDNVPDVVYRGVMLTDEQVEVYKQSNNCFQFTSFTSTSRDREHAELRGNALFIMDLNVLNVRGDEIVRVGAYIAPRSNFPSEKEFLMWPLIVFKFDKYEFDEEKQKHLVYLKSSLRPSSNTSSST